ncbi:MAG: hypothetical protein JWR72_4010, partial [Flavisolibacter sp.]|nr:hypothetical protein [Flavisolibacter sp.]
PSFSTTIYRLLRRTLVHFAILLSITETTLQIFNLTTIIKPRPCHPEARGIYGLCFDECCR